MTCPHCLSTSTSKRKLRTSLGYRTFYCRDCGRRFNESSGSPFNDLQFPTDTVLLAVHWRLRYKPADLSLISGPKTVPLLLTSDTHTLK